MASATRRRKAAAEPDTEPVRLVNGLKVIEDADVASPLPHGKPFRGLRALTLEDGTRCIGCAECDFTGEPVSGDTPPSRGDVLRHRMQDHEARKATGGGRRRADDPAVDAVQYMTVYELLDAGRQAHEMSRLVDTLIEQRDTARAEAAAVTRDYRKLVAALDRVGFVPKMEEED